VKRFLADTGYLLALCGDEARRTPAAKRTFDSLLSGRGNVLLVPWPILYEGLNSEFADNRSWMDRLARSWDKLQRSKKFEFVDDAPYRQQCFEEFSGIASERHGRFETLSLVDRILMDLLEDRSKPIEAFLTFDLRDFGNFCGKRGIEIIPGTT
jgi:hypothetical protein